MLKISVVMAVYNGQKYLMAQLRSLVQQTRLPDEILICDDCSQDNSEEIIKEFISNNRGINIIFKKNSKNVGWRRNFIQGINTVSGDVIFLSDQDDVWAQDKISVMTKIMEIHKEINVLTSNLRPMYELHSKVRVSKSTLRNIGTSELSKVEINPKNYYIRRPGCTMCFRKTIVPWINYLWWDKQAHDSLIWEIGLFTSSLYIYNRELICQRRHEDINTPLIKRTTADRYISCDIFESSLTRLISAAQLLNLDEDTILSIKKHIKFCNARKSALEGKRIEDAIKLFIWHREYPQMRMLLTDIYVCAFHRKAVGEDK